MSNRRSPPRPRRPSSGKAPWRLLRTSARRAQSRAAIAALEGFSPPAFRVLVAHRLRRLEREVGEVRARINGLLFVVLGAVVTAACLAAHRRSHGELLFAVFLNSIKGTVQSNERPRHAGLAHPALRPYQLEAGPRRARAPSSTAAASRSPSRSPARAARTSSPRRSSSSSSTLSAASAARGGEVRADLRCPSCGISLRRLWLHHYPGPHPATSPHAKRTPSASAARDSSSSPRSPTPTSSATRRACSSKWTRRRMSTPKVRPRVPPDGGDDKRHDGLLRHRLGRHDAARSREAGEPRSRAPRRRAPPLRVRLADDRAVRAGLRRVRGDRAPPSRRHASRVPDAVLPETRQRRRPPADAHAASAAVRHPPTPVAARARRGLRLPASTLPAARTTTTTLAPQGRGSPARVHWMRPGRIRPSCHIGRRDSGRC